MRIVFEASQVRELACEELTLKESVCRRLETGGEGYGGSQVHDASHRQAMLVGMFDQRGPCEGLLTAYDSFCSCF